MDIKVLKLITGEDIITQIKKEEKDYYLIVKPQKFIMTPDGIGSMPMIPISKDEEYKLEKQHVIFKCEAEDEIRNVYSSKYGSGVILPNTSSIIGG